LLSGAIGNFEKRRAITIKQAALCEAAKKIAWLVEERKSTETFYSSLT
jgi:hypothetical protein